MILSKFNWFIIFFSLVICLSDDDGDDSTNTKTVPIVNPIKRPPSSNINGDNNLEASQVSDWTVQRKDVIRIPELTIKHADLIKKTYELGCSAVCFGIIEFKVESEIALMKETEFELKLKSKNKRFVKHDSKWFIF